MLWWVRRWGVCVLLRVAHDSRNWRFSRWNIMSVLMMPLFTFRENGGLHSVFFSKMCIILLFVSLNSPPLYSHICVEKTVLALLLAMHITVIWDTRKCFRCHYTNADSSPWSQSVEVGWSAGLYRQHKRTSLSICLSPYVLFICVTHYLPSFD